MSVYVTMEGNISDKITLVAAVIIAVVMFMLYFIGSGQASKPAEGSITNHWDREVYLYYNPKEPKPDAAATARLLGGEVATNHQVNMYFKLGGTTHGHGLATSMYDDYFVAVSGVPTGMGSLVAKEWTSVDGEVGVWVFGFKPPPRTFGVTPHSNNHWFHPAPS